MRSKCVWGVSSFLEKKRYSRGVGVFNGFIVKLLGYKSYKNILYIVKINYIKLEIKNVLYRNVMYLDFKI